MINNKIVAEDIEVICEADIEWHKLFNSSILVTGANGLLPGYIVETLLYLNSVDFERNIKVLALVRNESIATKRFSSHLNDPNFKIVVQDVSDNIDLDEKIDYIIHAASQASPKYYGVDPVGTLKANVLGTLNLLELARKNPVKSFLYFSSAEIYGDIDISIDRLSERNIGFLDPTVIRSCYAESKRMGENICVSYYHQYGVPTKSVRPFHTYGPGMKLDDGRVYADFVSNVINGDDIVMKSDGSASRAFCYLTDATIAFFKVLVSGKNGESYNVGNPDQEFTVLGLAKIITNLFPEKKLSVVTAYGDKIDTNYIKSPLGRSCPDITKMSELGWYPTVDVKQGFRRTILSYQ